MLVTGLLKGLCGVIVVFFPILSVKGQIGVESIIDLINGRIGRGGVANCQFGVIFRAVVIIAIQELLLAVVFRRQLLSLPFTLVQLRLEVKGLLHAIRRTGML